MPAVKPLPPIAIRSLLEAHGFEVVGENEHAWAMMRRGADDAPLMVPRNTQLVPLDICFSIAKKVGFGEYVEFLQTGGFLNA